MNLMDLTTIDLTLSHKIDINLSQLDGITAKDIERHLYYLLTDYNDGRYPFDVELFSNGLRRCIKRAVIQAVEEVHGERYKGQYITTEDEKSSTSMAKWLATSEIVIKQLQFGFVNDWKVKITNE